MAPEDAAPAAAGSTTTTEPPAAANADPELTAWVGQLREAAGETPPTPPAAPAAAKKGSPAAPPAKTAAAPAAKGDENPEAAPEEEPVKPGAKRPSVAEANAKFASRRQAARVAAHEEVRRLKEHNDKLERIIHEALGGEPDAEGQPGRPAAKHGAPPSAEADPEPRFMDDPPAWHAWSRRQTQREIAAAVEPLVAEQNERKRLEGQQAEARRVQQEREEELRQLEEEYAATDEGEGWHERLELYQDVVPFAIKELIPGLPENHVQQLGALLISRRMREAIVISENTGLNPAFVLDRLFLANDLVSRAMQPLRGGNAGNGTAAAAGQPGAPAAAAPPPPAKKPATPPAARAEVASLQAAAAAPEAHSLGQGTSVSAAGGDEVEAMSRQGTLSANRLRAALQREGVKLNPRNVFSRLEEVEQRRQQA